LSAPDKLAAIRRRKSLLPSTLDRGRLPARGAERVAAPVLTASPDAKLLDDPTARGETSIPKNERPSVEALPTT